MDTTHSTVQNVEMTAITHDDLAERELLPCEHVVDSGYVTASHIERAARVHGITLLGPVVANNSPQAKAGSGFAKSAFPVAWDHRQATCPQGAVSREWRPLRINGAADVRPRQLRPAPQAGPPRSVRPFMIAVVVTLRGSGTKK
ncbi:hypothetical protein [Streptomyces sp. NPDC001530]|uniref:hypothetical protein n=1 Tax=Streptomyces sp. NPDC001530 TaxID=3364582 RepID=UPI0036C32443